MKPIDLMDGCRVKKLSIVSGEKGNNQRPGVEKERIILKEMGV